MIRRIDVSTSTNARVVDTFIDLDFEVGNGPVHMQTVLKDLAERLGTAGTLPPGNYSVRLLCVVTADEETGG